MRFRVIHGKRVFEQSFREAMPAHDATRPLTTHRRKLRFAVL